ncbi:MAG: hypothetical protein Q9N67_04255 [Ghiorsea sp.]|nr:hypothetical protein [Ghiorsea sp.]
MFNHTENPKEILEWLSQRNHHIAFEDLAYLMDTSAAQDDPETLGIFGDESDILSEFRSD